jgi:hypothetical protein
MKVASEIGADVHRRKHPRLRLGIPARLETIHGTREVDLLDLSQSGARLDAAQFPRVHTAVLHWLRWEALGDIVWQEDGLLGMTFDEPLSAEAVLTTRELAPLVVGDAAASEAAREWATGASQVSVSPERPRPV